ncbi:MAG: transcription-repair coupling factor [Candidatus Contubernalis sp.]|nr:transcription-repair coupling factor [Candidatus Contubernalis sp.]
MCGEFILNLLNEDENFKKVINNIGNNMSSQLIYGIDGSQKNLVMTAVKSNTRRPVLVVTTDLPRAEKIYEDFLNFFSTEEVLLFPARESIFYESITHSREITEQRLQVLEKINAGGDFLVIAPASALMSLLPPRDLWVEFSLKISEKSSFSLEELTQRLVQLGYERNPLVEGRGQFSLRGGILDIYPSTLRNPVRIEFFGDEAESLREFDLSSQRSQKSLMEVNINPVQELILDQEAFLRGKAGIEKDLENRLSALNRAGEREAAAKLQAKVEYHLEKIKEKIYFSEIEQYLPYFYSRLHNIMDYLPKDALVFLDEPVHILENSQKLTLELEETNGSLLSEGAILPGQTKLNKSIHDFIFTHKAPYLSFSLLMRKIPGFSPQSIVAISNKTMPRFHGQWDFLRGEINHWFKEGYRVFLLASSPERGREAAHSFEGENIRASYTAAPQNIAPGTVGVISCNMENGFILPELKTALISEQEIVPKFKKKKVWKTSREGITISDYHELEVGDYVVHEQHGIGQYLGIKTLEINQLNKDYLYIKYAGEDKLFIPTDQIDLVKKYIGGEGRKPKLHGMGSSEWSRVKSRVKESVQELAQELLKLYAVRESMQGHAYSPDHSWQREFEDRFPFEETPDQLKAIGDVKKDMENKKPMDRLICGDVGYGKTEIALRAAFKAVMEHKQAAFLVPTTILAQQHYRSFKERFEGFPVNIEVLSRFRKPSEQKEVIKQVKSGWVDIIIGTHRLLSSDIQFKDLGLLIIDEEQRFGVKHKEKIKMLRKNVDVLTMTATPIPRTLYMSLVGVRDLSVIETPPENRYPIQTYVVEYSEALIREALQREINRGGQVFFVYNRVETIEKRGEKLKEIIPDARIVIGHGQMPEARLEKNMFQFLNKDYDILLSTTIVEAGLDIPNVNTMIIYDADKMGLSQLYQLRGRVGRSNRLAYAYLTYQKDKVLSEVAEKRLQAIKEFTELGSGFKIALRDLEIRGAGNILGPEQHGFIVTVGFDLYCQLLEQSISELKGMPEEKTPEVKIELNVNAFIPASYIHHHSQKIYIYQKIAAIDSLEETSDVEREMSDRYGPVPQPVKNLLKIARVKVYGRRLKISSITHDKNQIKVKFYADFKGRGEDLLQVASSFSQEVSLQVGREVSFKLNVQGVQENFLVDCIENFCQKLLCLADNTAIHYN